MKALDGQREITRGNDWSWRVRARVTEPHPWRAIKMSLGWDVLLSGMTRIILLLVDAHARCVLRAADRRGGRKEAKEHGTYIVYRGKRSSENPKRAKLHVTGSKFLTPILHVCRLFTLSIS